MRERIGLAWTKVLHAPQTSYSSVLNNKPSTFFDNILLIAQMMVKIYLSLGNPSLLSSPVISQNFCPDDYGTQNSDSNFSPEDY